MKRRWFNIVTVCTLLLCLAFVVLWVRSYWVTDIIEHTTPYTERSGYWGIAVQSDRGSVFTGDFSTHRPIGLGEQGFTYGRYNAVYRTRDSTSTVTQMGFGYRYRYISHDDYLRAFVMPHWIFVLLTAILPTRWLSLYRRNRLRKLKGLCPKCGYDLRASKERCPECGTPVIVTEAKA